MTLTRLAAACALCVALLSGCGLDPETLTMEQAPGDGQMTTDRPADQETDDEASSDVLPDLPKESIGDLRTVTAEDAGLSFGAPEAWMVMDGSRMADLPDEVVEEMADAMGIGVDDVPAIMEQLEIIVVSTHGSSINVAPVMMAGEIPTEAALKAQFRMFNARVTRVEDTDSGLGQVRVARYRIDLAGTTQYGIAVIARLSTGIATVTIASFDRGLTEDLLPRILPTLEETGAPGEA